MKSNLTKGDYATAGLGFTLIFAFGVAIGLTCLKQKPQLAETPIPPIVPYISPDECKIRNFKYQLVIRIDANSPTQILLELEDAVKAIQQKTDGMPDSTMYGATNFKILPFMQHGWYAIPVCNDDITLSPSEKRRLRNQVTQ